MRRAGQFPLSMARDRRRRTFRRNVKYLPLGLLILAIAITPFWLLTHGRVRDFTAGLFVGGTVVALWKVLSDSPQAARQETSGYAEMWTSDRLQRELGAGWWVIDHLELDGFDVDHVVVGPDGVFAVETKWCGSPCRITKGGVEYFGRDYVRTATERAVAVRRLLLTDFHVEVRGVLCLWGDDLSEEQGAGRSFSGIEVLVGRDKSWRHTFQGQPIEQHTVEAIRDSLDYQIRRREEWCSKRERPGRSRVASDRFPAQTLKRRTLPLNESAT